MNVLATKHEMDQPTESKGRPLGRVGVAIVLSFVGLVFATAFLGVRAATVNTNIIISSANSRLTAVADDNLGEEGEKITWGWFSVATQYGTSSNNTDALAQECARADSLEGGASYLEKGLGASADLDADSSGNLYCFAAHIVSAEDGSEQSVEYGGYVVSQVETAE